MTENLTNHAKSRHPISDSGGFRTLAAATLWATLISGPMLAAGAAAIYPGWRAQRDARLAQIAFQDAYERLAAAPAGPTLPLEDAIHGRELFSTVCFACHGMDGKGLKGLGRSLVDSDLIASESDDQLRTLIAAGRPAGVPVPMPPKGGRADLTDQDLSHIITFVRGLQDPRRMPPLPAYVAAPPTADQKAAALAAAGGDAELAEYIASGDKLFHTTCIACHGKGGVGVPGNGKALVKNAFIQSLNDDQLLAFIQQGRSPSDPKNTTGIQMPPKGGNPAMTEDDLLDVIAYLRTLQPSAAVSSK